VRLKGVGGREWYIGPVYQTVVCSHKYCCTNKHNVQEPAKMSMYSKFCARTYQICIKLALNSITTQ
jgi:hypothetical protein